MQYIIILFVYSLKQSLPNKQNSFSETMAPTKTAKDSNAPKKPVS
jgi:hypothetical protein